MVKVCGDGDKNDEAELAELEDFNRTHRKIRTCSNEASTHDAQRSDPNSSSRRMVQPFTSTPMIAHEEPSLIAKSPVTDKFVETSVNPCPVCSFNNASTALSCSVCSNVLQAEFVPDWWSCKSSLCRDSIYINAGDVGRCGICGSKNSIIGHS